SGGTNDAYAFKSVHPDRSSKREKGFSLIELLCVIAIIGLLAAMLLPTVSKTKGKAQRLECMNNLKQIGVAFHTFMHDHNGRFPMQSAMSESGTLEFVHNGYRVTGDFYFAFRHFQALSNELQVPKLLVCPSDMERIAATNFSTLNNGNVSYF